MTSLAVASSADDVDVGVGVDDKLGARGGDEGDGLGDWFIGECIGAGPKVGIGADEDNSKSDPSWGTGDRDVTNGEDWEMENPTKETAKSKTT